jgi:hypothetical protein
MNNLVSINRGKVLGDYIDAQFGETTEDAYFYAGVLLSVVLPQYALSVYGRFFPMIAFAITGLVGLTLGLARYYWFPYQSLSCVDSKAVTRIPPRANILSKKIA